LLDEGEVRDVVEAWFRRNKTLLEGERVLEVGRAHPPSEALCAYCFWPFLPGERVWKVTAARSRRSTFKRMWFYHDRCLERLRKSLLRDGRF